MDAERLHPESVSVELSGCSKEDARAVFDALCARYASSDRHTGDATREYHEVRPTVWLGTFDVADARRDESGPAALRESVDADVQGGYWAIERFRTTLDSLFTVHDLSTASGDQERELHVRLESR
ncbi:hypothetical protein LZP81_09815 [Streptomyces parvulus]|uniref:Uncharacterized protein n=1 Tax=Streptomyces parvulus TaxID=146923 RepID=A0A191UTK3_9ACTN|nr:MULTISPECIES: hypothetical protein [Streptomyces]ANJ06051.1 hypothetical protein Spa2297_03050 [Streptomyces parvulus]MCC9152704.1 hypothetical protein [Streptomyces parvulus]MCE7687148.1 hypothetical protein [Streptomyces parvulus]MCQ4192178.1 hypothetical protein [Streptomyces parvulus]MZD56393.1 hypothetical protein [Streptomyces sp. SID5606]